jgi:NAD dependent epimerase/dehydratase family enzyme
MLQCGKFFINEWYCFLLISDFTKAVAKALGRPMFLPAVPGFLLKIALGELSSILLGGSRASNAKLLGSGFTFRYDALDAALKDCLK